MGPAAQIVAQVNKELIDISKQNNKPVNDTGIAIEEEEEDAGKEEDDDVEGVIEAGADEDESDEGADEESEVEEGEEEEDKGEEDSDDGEEGAGQEDDEQEVLTKSTNKAKGKSIARAKNTALMKKGRGGKGSGGKRTNTSKVEKANDTIAGSSKKEDQKSLAARKRKANESVPEPKADNKRGKKVLKKRA